MQKKHAKLRIKAATRASRYPTAPTKDRWASDVIVDLMHAYDLPHAALNPGASYRGLHDSIVNYGQNRPTMMLCQHEETAVQVAHGYAKATGKPMIAILHNLVGLLHANMAIYYAYIDRAPIFIIGATGPMDETKRRPRIDCSWFMPTAPPGVARQRNAWVSTAENTTSHSPSRTLAIAASRSAGAMNGDVACRNTRMSGASSSRSSTLSRADSELAVSVDSRAGRAMISAPSILAAAAIARSSVVTTTRSTSAAWRADAAALATSGTPPTSRRFFPLTPFDPPRAGMTASTMGWSAAPPGRRVILTS